MNTGYRVLEAGEAFWRPSNLMGVQNTDIAKQLDVPWLAARLWRLEAGQASTRHRHPEQHELYLLLDGTGRMRVGDELLTLAPLSAVVVEPAVVRQVFNDTDRDALWFVAGAPREALVGAELPEELMAQMYPDGPRALPPELSR